MNIDKLDDVMNEYNNTDRTIKVKPVDVQYGNYIEYNVYSIFNKIKIENWKSSI